MPIKEEFISQEKKNYRFKIGRTLASGLTGLIAGFIITAIILIPVLLLIKYF